MKKIISLFCILITIGCEKEIKAPMANKIGKHKRRQRIRGNTGQHERNNKKSTRTTRTIGRKRPKKRTKPIDQYRPR